MLHRKTADRILIVLIPAVWFVYESTRPLLRLRARAPAQFMGATASSGAGGSTGEEAIAKAYWDCAVTLIQWQYTYGSALPELPPDDFRIYGKGAGGGQADATSRLRYWRGLRRLWMSPETWDSSREWSTQW